MSDFGTACAVPKAGPPPPETDPAQAAYARYRRAWREGVEAWLDHGRPEGFIVDEGRGR